MGPFGSVEGIATSADAAVASASSLKSTCLDAEAVGGRGLS